MMAYKKYYLFTLFFIFFISVALSQIFEKIPPRSISFNLAQEIPQFNCKTFNIDSLQNVDKQEELQGNKAWRFGFAENVDLSIYNAGKWEVLENGDKIWRLEIFSEQALSLNFTYSYFNIPEGATFHIYCPDYKEVLGAYTQRNVHHDNSFSTAPLPGNKSILEYYEPANSIFNGGIVISTIISGYKNVFSKIKSFGDSGSCNNNINCPEGNDWQVEKKSIAMIVTSGGTRLCTGALINNVKNDGTPYFLTAYHCLGGESSWIFYFNYESPGCANVDGPTNYTVQGCTRVAANSASDFGLLRLNQRPQDYFDVYYSGWQRNDIPSPNTTCIHHPRGDIKKISFDFDSCFHSKYLDNQGLDISHWKIMKWDDGTTEGGSSGSPLFDNQHRIIGQLHGGWASCTSLTADFFGSFAMSWDYGTTAATRLKEWLDPDNINPYQWDGFFGGNLTFNKDVKLLEVIEPTVPYICSDSISPVINIQNSGALSFDSINVFYKIDNQPEILYTWQGMLGFNGIAEIPLPALPLAYGNHVMSVRLDLQGDQNNANDTTSVNFSSAIQGIRIVLNTDDKGYETQWSIFDSNGTAVHQGEGYGNRQTYDNHYCLMDDCYTFVLYDTGHDGMYSGITGNYSVYQDSQLIFSGNGFFNDSVSHYFCFTTSNNFIEMKNSFPLISPNPFTESLLVNSWFTELPYQISISNALGENLINETISSSIQQVSTTGLKPGVYFARFISGNREVFVRKIFKINR